MDNLEYDKLAEAVNPNKNKLNYEKNKHLFVKVAFDVFQLKNSPIESYWILETDNDDGKQYLYAKYEDTNSEELVSEGKWKAFSDKEAQNVTVYYQDVPIKRCASKDFNFDKDDVHVFSNALVSKLSKDNEFVSLLIDSLPENKKQALTEQFPELL